MAMLTILPRRGDKGEGSFSDIAFSFPNQLKKINQMVNVKNRARHGYTTISGVSSGSSLMRTKNRRTITASTMPITPQSIHEGKNEPRILNEGEREHAT